MFIFVFKTVHNKIKKEIAGCSSESKINSKSFFRSLTLKKNSAFLKDDFQPLYQMPLRFEFFNMIYLQSFALQSENVDSNGRQKVFSSIRFSIFHCEINLSFKNKHFKICLTSNLYKW